MNCHTLIRRAIFLLLFGMEIFSLIGCSSHTDFDEPTAAESSVTPAQKTQAENTIARFVSDLNSQNLSDLRALCFPSAQANWSKINLSKQINGPYKPFIGASQISCNSFESADKGYGLIAIFRFKSSDGHPYLSDFMFKKSGTQWLVFSIAQPMPVVNKTPRRNKQYKKI
jgi:hypothetical protein